MLRYRALLRSSANLRRPTDLERGTNLGLDGGDEGDAGAASSPDDGISSQPPSSSISKSACIGLNLRPDRRIQFRFQLWAYWARPIRPIWLSLFCGLARAQMCCDLGMVEPIT